MGFSRGAGVDSLTRKRAKACILGALVADAATMGLHWVYSQKRILELAPETPEFRRPDEADYAGGVGYFAHAGKVAGDFSHYGEQMLVMLESLLQGGGGYQKASYQEAFRNHFGYGGAFTGYIDRPTRQTLDRIYADENAALQAVNAIPFNGDSKDKQGMLTKVLAAVKILDGEPLRARVKAYADGTSEPEACLDYGLALADALSGSAAFPGADDEQLPAVSKLPPLIGCSAGAQNLIEQIESAIRVTNNAPRALAYGRVCAAMLESAVLGGSRQEILDTGVAAAEGEASEGLNRALTMDASASQVAREFGLHCDLGAGVPSLVQNFAHAPSFKAAVRSNLYAGGDNCGRAIVLGGIAGAFFGLGGEKGIPTEWLAKTRDAERLEADVDELLAQRSNK